ncbi:hypothetical protein RCL1_001220 [Eukaryota sp. TZLM3-RCL]
MTQKKSFQVVEAQSTEGMVFKFIVNIIEEDQQSKAEKQKEVMQRKLKHETDRQLANSLSCHCQFLPLDPLQVPHKSHGQQCKRVYCQKCKLTSKMRRNVVELFEDRLPHSSELQFAIVFEACLPREIRLLYTAYTLICQCLYTFKTNDSKVYGPWIDSLSGRHFHDEEHSTAHLPSFYLDSHRSSFIKSHYSTLHIDALLAQFTVPCGRTVVLCSKVSGFGFNIDSPLLPTVTNVPLPSPYTSLKPFFSPYHTQNDVLATLSECPQDLLLSQFHASLF